MFVGSHHVALAVRNLDQALAFYHGTLGLPLGKQATVVDQGVKAALLPVGHSEIELLEPTNPNGGVAKFLEKKGEGPHHLCLETTDVSAALTEAKAAGLKLIDQAPRKGLAGMIGFMHPADTCGVLVEIAQPGPAEGHHPEVPTQGVGAFEIEVVYVGAKDLEAAAGVYARNFGAKVSPVMRNDALGAGVAVAEIGRSHVALVDVGASAGSLFAERNEGLLGVGLRVKDFAAAVRCLETAGIRVTARSGSNGAPVGRLDTDRSHGLMLLISA